VSTSTELPTSRRLDLATAGSLSVADVLGRLQSSDTGLTSAEAVRRRVEFGANVLASHTVTAFGVLIRQLRNPLLILLLAAAAVSAATGDTTDSAIIAAIVALSVGLGFFNEYRSEVAVAALHAHIHHETLVWRDGTQQRLDVADLVPGDVVAIGVGDLVPADLRLIEVSQLECEEAVLTGESALATKVIAPGAGDSTIDLPSCIRDRAGRWSWPPARRRRSARSRSAWASDRQRPRSRQACGASRGSSYAWREG
jgi:Mg2+-importing ATPase